MAWNHSLKGLLLKRRNRQKIAYIVIKQLPIFSSICRLKEILSDLAEIRLFHFMPPLIKSVTEQGGLKIFLRHTLESLYATDIQFIVLF